MEPCRRHDTVLFGFIVCIKCVLLFADALENIMNEFFFFFLYCLPVNESANFVLLMMMLLL
jgi:hypothetical protein